MKTVCRFISLQIVFGVLLFCSGCYTPTLVHQPQLKGTVFHPDGITPLTNCLVVFSAYEITSFGINQGETEKFLESKYTFSDSRGHFILPSFNFFAIQGGNIGRSQHQVIGFEAACAENFVRLGIERGAINQSNQNNVKIIMRKATAWSAYGCLYQFLRAYERGSWEVQKISFQGEDYVKLLALVEKIEQIDSIEDPKNFQFHRKQFQKLEDDLRQHI